MDVEHQFDILMGPKNCGDLTHIKILEKQTYEFATKGVTFINYDGDMFYANKLQCKCMQMLPNGVSPI